MCHQNIEKHTPCTHHTRYKPHFCRYRFNINHQIEPRYTYSNTLCKSCLSGNIRPASLNLSASSCERGVDGECQKKDGDRIRADEIGKGAKDRRGQEGNRGEESEWKRKLRNKLVKGKGNEEVLRGSMMVDAVEETEEKEWKRKLRD